MRPSCSARAARGCAGVAGAVALSLVISSHASAAALLYVRSTPPGARVFVDDEQDARGTTPYFVRDLPAGKHVLRLTLDGYEEGTREVVVPERGMKNVDVTLTEGRPAESPASGADSAPAPQPEAPRGKDAAASGADGSKAVEPDAKAERPDVPRTIEITCPVCDGSGLIKEIGCPYCHSTGYEGFAQCTHCGGTRRIPYLCPTCEGKGELVSGPRTVTCPACGGKKYLSCPACRGKGKIPRLNPAAFGKPTVSCEACGGGGFERSAKCLKCYGTGKITLTVTTTANTNANANAGANAVTQRQQVDCPFCSGTGKGRPICRRCQGWGCKGPREKSYPCPGCYGTGYAFENCSKCGGRGWLPEKAAQ